MSSIVNILLTVLALAYNHARYRSSSISNQHIFQYVTFDIYFVLLHILHIYIFVTRSPDSQLLHWAEPSQTSQTFTQLSQNVSDLV